MTKQYFITDLFGIDGFNIAWYGVIIAIGMIIGLLFACKNAKRQGIKEELIVDFVLFALPISIIGARIYYVIFEWDNYKDHLIKIFAIREGGLAIYGGIIAGFLSAILYCNRKKISLLEFLDIAVPSLAIGQSIGRWGNFTNQEAYGSLITDYSKQFFPYGVYIEALGEWHQATFFYESLFNFLLFLFLYEYSKRKAFHGQIFDFYLIGYGVARTFLEGLRVDSLYLGYNIRISQMVSLLMVLIGCALLFRGRKNRKHQRILS